MAVGVIVVFEIVYIKHEDRKGKRIITRLTDRLVCSFKKVPFIE